MNLTNLILRSISYFKTGFAQYISYPIQLITFTSSLWLIVKDWPIIQTIFTYGYLEWVIILCILLYPIGHVAGVLHYKRLLFPVEQDILTESNPYSQEILAPIMVPLYKVMLKIGQNNEVDAETVAQIETILKATAVKRPVIREDPMKRRMRKLRSSFIPRIRSILPKRLQWVMTQRAYTDWANTPLPSEYIKFIVKRGAEFRDFVGTPGKIIDVGCGNGLISGTTCVKIGYAPLIKGRYPICGLDPLPLEAPIPWITVFFQGRCEDPLPVSAEYATFITSYDHLEDPALCLSRLKEAGVKGIFIWETLSRIRVGGDAAHLKRYTREEVEEVLSSAGFAVKRFVVKDDAPDWIECFIEAELK